MALNRNNIPQPLLAEAIMSVESSEMALADSMCTEIPVAATAGTFTVEPLGNMLASGDSQGGIAEGASGEEFFLDLGEQAYACKRYEGKAVIPDGNVTDANAAGYNIVERAAKRARMQSNFDLDVALYDALNGESTTQAASAAWTLGTSTPIVDLQNLFNKLADPDTLYVGRTSMQAWQVHPDFTSRISNYAGGAADVSSIVAILRGVFPHLQNIYYEQRLYNDANEGQSVSLSASSYKFRTLLWAGHKASLIKCEHGTYSEMGRDVDRQADKLVYGRRSAIVRPTAHAALGGKMTGHVS